MSSKENTEYSQEIIDEYISTLSNIELIVMKIAEEDLKSSFDIVKSIGFLDWIKKNKL